MADTGRGSIRKYFDLHGIKYDKDAEWEIPCNLIHDGMVLRWCVDAPNCEIQFNEIVTVEGYHCKKCRQEHYVLVNHVRGLAAPIDAFIVEDIGGRDMLIGFEVCLGGIQ